MFEKEVSMYCPDCGTQIEEGSLFCANCGAQLPVDAELGAPSPLDSNFETVPLTSFETEMTPGAVPAAFVGVQQPANSAAPYEAAPPYSSAPYGSAPYGSAPSDSAVSSQPYDSIRSSLSGQQSYQGGQEIAQKRGGNKTQTALLIGAAVAMALLMAVLFGLGSEGSGTLVPEKAYADLVAVDFALNAEGGTDDMSAVPIHITGTDKDGNKVDAKVAYKPNSSSVKLRPGHYIAKLFSSPISGDNKLYDYPDKDYAFDVPAKSDSSSSSKPAPVVVAKDDPIPLTKRDASEEEVKKAKDEIEKLPEKIEPTPTPAPTYSSSSEQGDTSSSAATSSEEVVVVEPTSSSEVKEASLSETDVQRQEREKEEARVAAQKKIDEEKQVALDANPTVVQSTPTPQESELVTITGILKENAAYSEPEQKDVTVYTLELPNKLMVKGTQYQDISSDKLIIFNQDGKLDPYIGETIQVKTQLSVCITASIPEAQFSPIYCNDDYEFIRDFKLNGFVVTDAKGVDYRVVTDYYEFDVPESWRGKIDYKFTGKGSVGAWAGDAIQETILSVKESGDPFADIVCLPVNASERYKENNFFSDATITMGMFETDAYTVVAQWYNYYLHYEDPTGSYMTISTGKENSKDTPGEDLINAGIEFFTKNLVNTVKVKNSKGDLEKDKVVYIAEPTKEEAPAEESTDKANDAQEQAKDESEAERTALLEQVLEE